jgi:hypothetical protein
MLKLRNRVITALAILATVLMIGSFAMFFGGRANASEPTLSTGSVEILDSYLVGTELDVPNGEITVDGTSYPAEVVYMYTPDGKLVEVAGAKYEFEEIGVYKLVYTATVSGKQVSVEKSIKVDNTSYVSSQYTTTNILENGLSTVAGNTDKGIHVNLPYTDTFTWSTPVDLRETGLSTSVISFLPYQWSKEKVVGEGESAITPKQVGNVYVRLTDAYDKNVYVDVRLEYFVNQSTANQMPAYAAGAARQQVRALSTNLGRDSREGQLKLVNGTQYFVTYDERGGYPYLGAIPTESGLIDIFYDLSTNQVYVGQKVGTESYKKSLINDIDAPEVYGEGAFAGFTTGEVYVSLYATEYVSANGTVDMEIASIGNMSGEALFDNVAKDEKSPELKVAVSLDQEENGLYVAKGTEVKVLEYDVKDVNFKGNKMTVKVQYNDSVDVTVENGKFLAKDLGKYTITYRAEDDFGNVTVKELVYNCIDCSANGNKLIKFIPNDYTGDKKAGQEITLPQVGVESKNTYVNVNVYALFEGKKIAIDAENPVLRIDNVGKYTIVYEYADIFESGEYRYDIVTEEGTAFDWMAPALPKYMIKDAKYSLDKVYVQTYKTAIPELVEVGYEVNLDGAGWTPVADYQAFEVKASTSVQFRYTYNGNTSEPSKVMPVVDVGFKGNNKLDLSKYFQGDITAEAYNGTSFAFVANAGLTSANIDFINVMSLNNMYLNFEIPASMRNFKKMTITLTDYLDQTNSVSIEYADSGSGTSFGLKDGTKVSITKAFAGTAFAFNYSVSRKQFADNTLGTTASWVNEFKSDRVLVSIQLEEVTPDAKAGVVITGLAGVTINNSKADRAKPTATYDDSLRGNQSVGTKLVISAATGTDVVCPSFYQVGKLKVIAERVLPSGETIPLVADDGTELSFENQTLATKAFEVTLTEIGQYDITYQYTDQKNQTTTSSYTINIVDEEKPVITIEGGYNEFSVIEAELGDIITAKDYTLTDNIDSEEEMVFCIVVFDPYFTMYDLIDNNCEIDDLKFTAEYRGEYVVYYYAEDSSGNVATASYRIFVK